jgi:cytochrome c-type biogenesis protein CcmE
VDPSRKRAIRLTVALTAALLLAVALVYVSFTAGSKEVTASQFLTQARTGKTYELAGTVLVGSVRHEGATLLFRIRDPKLASVSVPVRYTGVVPDPFAGGRAVMVAVKPDGATAVGQENSLTTKCPSKYQAAAAS